jgi:hypothetical protein
MQFFSARKMMMIKLCAKKCSSSISLGRKVYVHDYPRLAYSFSKTRQDEVRLGSG